MRTLICGGRNFNDKFFIFNRLDLTPGISVIITGAARGVDSIAIEWAIMKELPFIGEPARWTKYGASAGAIRNATMVENWQPEKVIAFPGGNGTKNMIAVAKAAGITVEFAGW